jgi:hypothetical protein
MFGMLDYRAHKLYWLISLPFRLIARIIFFATILVGIVITQATTFSIPIKIVIAYASVEAIGLVVLLTIVWGMTSVLNRIFFFLVDVVVPAHGDNVQEAKAIALTGRYFELNKKFETDIENWTYEDTNEFVSSANWRQRLFFPLKDRLSRLVPELQRIYYETGTQPGDLGGYKIAAIRESLPGGKISWFEKAIANTQTFNALVAFAIVAAVLIYLNPSHDSAQSLNNTATLGAPNTQMSQSEIDALRARISSCWRPPPGIDANSKLYVVLRVLFKIDGSMLQAPVLVESTASPLSPALAESATQALLLCQPFTMQQSGHYQQWKDLELKFDPHELLSN